MASNPFSDLSDNYVRSPLGIIALFIVLVYAVAGLVTVFAPLPYEQLWAIIGFIVGFPCLVLWTSFWLVTRYPDLIYGPADFQNEENFLRYRSVAGPSSTGNDPAEILREFWRPGGKAINQANNKRLVEWMTAETLPTLSVTAFLSSSQFADDRHRAVRDLGLS